MCLFLVRTAISGTLIAHTLFSDVRGQGSGQTLANLDTGTSLSQIPQSYGDAIYGSIPGAEFDETQGIYTVPCSAEISLSFIFNGIEYPIHPIDTVAAQSDGEGGVVCFSGFPVGSDDSEDFLLGDSFLRNVYTVFNYGSFFNESSSPSIQLLSVSSSRHSPPTNHSHPLTFGFLTKTDYGRKPSIF